MSKTVAFAKTTRPSLAGVLQRARLFDSLDRRRRAALVWVSGPAGAGKTTLAASYLDARPSASIWYQLDPADEDIGTFFHYMHLAVDHLLQARGGVPQLPIPFYRTENQTAPTEFARRFFRAVFAALDTPFVLVFDNHQEVSPASLLHEVLLVALGELPPAGCVWVLSRVDPPPGMARLRANRQLELLGWPELKLTREESDAIVERSGAPASDEYLERLYSRTRGWAAGLILMLDQGPSALDSRAVDPSAPQVVFDYLAGEIFDGFDDATRSVLLATALLPEMTAAMACELSGLDRAPEILAEMHHNYHLVGRRPGPDAPVYHYHPLLRELLKNRLRSLWNTAERRTLLRQSASCLERHDAVAEAVDLVLEASDWSEFARLLTLHGRKFIRQGRIETVEAWIARVPEAQCRAHPSIDLCRAECKRDSSPREARFLFEKAYTGLAAETPPTLGAVMQCVAGVLDCVTAEGDDLSLLDRWLDAAKRYLATGFPDGVADAWPAPTRRAALALSACLAMALRRPGDPTLPRLLEDVSESLRKAPDDAWWCAARARLAELLALRGAPDLALDALRGCSASLAGPDTSTQVRADLQHARVLVHALDYDLDACLAALEFNDEFADSLGDARQFRQSVHAMTAAIGSERYDVAMDLEQQARSLSQSARRVDRSLLGYAAGWLAQAQGESWQAIVHLREAVRLARECGSVQQELAYSCVLAALKCMADPTATNLRSLSRLRRAVRGLRNPMLAFMSLMLQAEALLEMSRAPAALIALRVGLRTARDAGLTSHPWWIPASMARLCRFALESGVEPEFARQLIRQRDLNPPACARQSVDWPWRFQVYTLGSFRVLREGKPLGLTARLRQKPLELLRTLVALGGRQVSETRLIEAMWPRIDPDSAQRSLTTNLHRLRKLLGEDRALVLRFGRLSLNEKYCWTDVWAFEALTTAADDESAALFEVPARGERADELAAGILACYRGPFLAEDGESAQYHPMRQRLRSRLLRVAAQLVEQWAQQGNWAPSYAFLNRAIEADPDLEGLYRRLMICYRDGGRPADAMDVYERCREVCKGGIRSTPAPETAAVFNSILGSL